MSTFLWFMFVVIGITVVAILFSIRHLRLLDTGYQEAVRIAIIYDNRVLLVPHRSNHARYKHPLYVEMHRKESKEDALKRLMDAYLPNFDEEPQFLLKYQVKDKANNVVYLYVLNISSEDKIITIIPNGSFLDCMTVDRYAEDGRLSPNFMEEFSYLRNTVILCNSLIFNRNKCKVE